MSHLVFVTGASGRIGGYVTRALIDAGHRVRVLLFPEDNAPAGVEVIRGRLPHLPDGALDGCDTVIHLAAVLTGTLDRTFHAANVLGTRAVADAALAAGARLIYSSSVSVYGLKDDGLPFRTGDTPHPRCAYGRSKLAGESEVNRVPGSAILRITMVVGTRDRNSGKLRRIAKLGVFPVSPYRFSAIAADDLARCFVHLVEHPEIAGTFTVSDGAFYSFDSLATHFERETGKRLLRIPGWPLGKMGLVAKLLGRPNGPLHFTHDRHAEPNFPPGFEPAARAFAFAPDAGAGGRINRKRR
ncbi:NAD-dependent epimerase/dehydratase family protein [bacterium]|nr:NAD-dependent epimerase/dehydratase family protein [bacterium]